MTARSVSQPDGVRTNTHAMWASVAPAWGEHAAFVDARAAAVTAALLDAAALHPGDRVLELACGAGGVGLEAARRVGPGGEVVVSDVAAEMTEIAAARAVERGLTNVRTRVLDLEDIDEPDNGFDVVVCRDGLMFAIDHDRVAREIRRVLRPGGRIALAVWGPRDRNPWLALVFDAVSSQLGMPVPPPGIPGPFALDDAERLAAVLSGAGLSQVDVKEVATPMVVGSFDEWWTRTLALAGPLAAIVESLPHEAKQSIQDRLRAAVTPYETDAGIDIPGINLVARAIG